MQEKFFGIHRVVYLVNIFLWPHNGTRTSVDNSFAALLAHFCIRVLVKINDDSKSKVYT